MPRSKPKSSRLIFLKNNRKHPIFFTISFVNLCGRVVLGFTFFFFFCSSSSRSINSFNEKVYVLFVCTVATFGVCCAGYHKWVELSVMVLLGRARVSSSLAVLLCMFPTVLLGFSSTGAVPVPCRVCSIEARKFFHVLVKYSQKTTLMCKSEQLNMSSASGPVVG